MIMENIKKSGTFKNNEKWKKLNGLAGQGAAWRSIVWRRMAWYGGVWQDKEQFLNKRNVRT